MVRLRFGLAKASGLLFVSAQLAAAEPETKVLDINLRELDAEPIRAVAAHPEMRRAFQVLLFSVNGEERLVARRTLRTAWLAKPHGIPPTGGTNFPPIDRFILAQWEAAGVRLNERLPEICDDAAFARRVYLDVIGVIPTIDEAQRFVRDTAADKRARLVDELLGRSADYAAHWTPFWEALLWWNPDPAEEESRRRFRDWLFGSFAQNKPFDVLTAELIDPSMPGFFQAGSTDSNAPRRSTGFIRNDSKDSVLASAERVARLFLGANLGPSSSPNPAWPEERVLAFAGLLSPKDLEIVRDGKPGKTIPAAFPFELAGAPTEVPASLEGRLQRLAQLLVDPANPRFAKVIVNRLWQRYIGAGLFESLDETNAKATTASADLLHWLADDFIQSGYNLKHSTRTILTSRTYQLRHDRDLVDSGDPSKRIFRSPPIRPLTIEQLIDSIRLAADQNLDSQNRAHFDGMALAMMRTVEQTNTGASATPVRLTEMLQNENLRARIFSSALLDPFVEQNRLNEAVERLHWAALSRGPSNSERQQGTNYLGTLENSASNPFEVVWIEDDLPETGTVSGSAGTNSWIWGEKPSHPVFSGEKSHTQGGAGEQRQHFFNHAAKPLTAGPEDVLFAYVYLDVQQPPRQIMLQWNDGSWEHRAYWGENLIRLGENNTASRRPMGPLPKPGQWFRLDVPANEIGLKTNSALIGMSFDQLGGRLYWDKSGIQKPLRLPSKQRLGEYLWLLLSQPEFEANR